jgi:dipeptidyl-peptidase-4
LLQESPENGENQTFDSSKKLLAYTEANNLYILNTNKETVAVTQNSDKNIVSGQSISRNEFGISGGIFWSPKSTYLAFLSKR